MSWSYEADKDKDKIGPLDVVVVDEDGKTEDLKNHGYHSPDGFQIGYEGSGPSDLAYSILTDYMLRCKDVDMADIPGKVELLHQDFKRAYIANAKEYIRISSALIYSWLRMQENKNGV